MSISLKDAERIVHLHASVKSLRADLAALADGRITVEGSVYIKTGGKSDGWGGNSDAKDFRYQNAEAQKLARQFITRSKELTLEACIRELNQLNAEIPS